MRRLSALMTAVIITDQPVLKAGGDYWADVSGLQPQIVSPIEISIPSRASTALGNRS